MAGRNVKRGLMYFRLDCGLFQDRKLKRLMRRWQNDGLAVYLALLCEIYRDKGYYIVADQDLIADIADTCLLDDDRTSSIFHDCIELGLFDRQLYEHSELLTSRGIQARYLDIMAVLRRKAGIDAEYSLISSEEIGDNSATIDDDSERIADSSVKIRKNTQKCRFMQNDSEDIPQSAEETAIPSDKKEKKNRENNGKTDTHTHGIEEREGGAGETMPENDRLALASFGRRWNELARHEKMFLWTRCNYPIMFEFERPLILANCRSIAERISDWRDIERLMESIANRRDVLATHTSAIATFNSFARMDHILKRKQNI